MRKQPPPLNTRHGLPPEREYSSDTSLSHGPPQKPNEVADLYLPETCKCQGPRMTHGSCQDTCLNSSRGRRRQLFESAPIYAKTLGIMKSWISSICIYSVWTCENILYMYCKPSSHINTPLVGALLSPQNCYLQIQSLCRLIWYQLEQPWLCWFLLCLISFCPNYFLCTWYGWLLVSTL